MKDFSFYARENILKLKPYSSAREEYTGSASIYMDANENPFSSDFNRYPDPLHREIKQLLAPIKDVPEGKIFIGNGSDEALDIIFRIFCHPSKDNIIVSSPTYGMYQVLADIHDIHTIDIPLTPQLNLDVDKILSKKAKIVFICNPNNPTGTLFPRKDILRILEGFEGIVVVDEAYMDFAGDSVVGLISSYSNLVVCQTFSKAWGLAGLRVGMAFANSRLIDLMMKVKMPYNVNILSQKEIIKALQNHQSNQLIINTILQQRKWLEDKLSEFEQVIEIFPSAANFIMVKFDVPTEPLYNFLSSKGLLVRNQSNKIHCQNTLRITVGTESENQELIRLLNIFFSTD